MEASAAGLAGAASGDGQAAGQQGSEGAPAQGEQQAQQQATGTDAIAQMAETLQGLQSSQEEMRQFLEAQGQQQGGAEQQQDEQQPPVADLSFLDESSPNYDPQRAAERLTEVMRQQAGVATQQELAKVLEPLQKQVSDMQRAHEADALVAEFPDLGKEEVAAPVIKAAEQYAQMMNMPELATNTAFIRMTYLAGRAAELAQQQQEGAAGAPGAATLEGAGGASPGGAGQGATQTADSIRESWSQGGNVLAKL